MQAKSIEECWAHSAILSTLIKLLFVIKIFVLSILGGCLRHVLLYTLIMPLTLEKLKGHIALGLSVCMCVWPCVRY